MEDRTFENLENYIGRVMPQVISCPREIVLDALQAVCVDFFKETKVWLETFKTSLPGTNKTEKLDLSALISQVYTSGSGSCAVLVSVESIRIDGITCGNADYSVEGDTIIFYNLPDGGLGGTVAIEVILRPRRWSTIIPKDLMEEYGDVIIAGTLAKLKVMHAGTVDEEEQKSVTWSDQQTAAVYLEEYRHGVNKAKLRAHIVRGFNNSLVKPSRW